MAVPPIEQLVLVPAWDALSLPRSWTIQPPPQLKDVEAASSIQVLLVGQFYVNSVQPAVAEQVNEHFHTAVKAGLHDQLLIA